MIKISPKTERLIYENQERNYGGVVPPQFGVKGQVKNYFSSRGNNVEFRLEKVRRAVPLDKEMKILDLGCGYGLMVVGLRKLGFKAFGCDSDSYSITIAKQILSENKMDPRIIIKNSKRLPYREGTFDFVYLNHVLTYVKDLSSFFKEIRRVLKKNGRVYLIGPNYQCCYDINYGVFLFPWFPKWFNKFYLRLLGRKDSFLDIVTFTTKNLLERLFRENNFSFKNVGIEEWLNIFDEPISAGRSVFLKKLLPFVKKFRLEFVFRFLARLGFYTPLVYVLEKQ